MYHHPVYLHKSLKFLKFKNQYPPKGLAIEIPAETGIMIDTELEFKIVEMMLKQKLI